MAAMPYLQRYVAFIDILGFGEIVKATDQAPTSTRYDELVKALTETDARARQHGELDDFRFQSFSDSIVISSEATPAGLRHVLTSITDLALNLLSVGLLIRGAVAKGKLHHDKSVMFGPAFLQAYQMETRIANFPRVILSRDVYEDFRQAASGIGLLQILLSEDGPPHLHIFASLEGPSKIEDPLKLQCQRVLQNLVHESIFEPKHYEKIRWLAIYWNSTVARFVGASRIEFPVAQNLELRWNSPNSDRREERC
jgi:hypothetical protein